MVVLILHDAKQSNQRTCKLIMYIFESSHYASSICIS